MNKKSLNWSLSIASFISAFVFAGLIWNTDTGNIVVWYYFAGWIALNAIILIIRLKFIKTTPKV